MKKFYNLWARSAIEVTNICLFFETFFELQPSILFENGKRKIFNISEYDTVCSYFSWSKRAGAQQKVQVGMCSHPRLRSACAFPVWPKRSMRAFGVAEGPTFLQKVNLDHVQTVKNTEDVQTDFILQCIHTQPCPLCWIPAQKIENTR